MQEMRSGSCVEQKDGAIDPAAVGLVAIDDAESMTLQDAKGPPLEVLVANAIFHVPESGKIAAVRRMADQTAIGVEDDPTILRRQTELVGVNEDVVAGIIGILYGTEQRVGSSAKGYVERPTAGSLLMKEDGDGERDRGGKLREEHDATTRSTME